MNQIFGHIVSEIWVRPAERPRSLHVIHVQVWVFSGSKDMRIKSTDYSFLRRYKRDWEQGEPLSRVNPGLAPASLRPAMDKRYIK